MQFMRKIVLFALILWVAPVANGIDLSCQTLPQVFDFYLGNHYLHQKLTGQLKDRTVEQFVKRLDTSKSLLLVSDLKETKTLAEGLFRTMKKGDCTALTKVRDMMYKRAKESEDFVRGFLGKKYKFNENTKVVLDPKKREAPKSNEERFDLLRKMVHFQISNYLLADVKMKAAKKKLIHRYELITKRMKEQDLQDMITQFAEAFALALDPHSTFLSRDDMVDFRIQMQLSLEGIGASLSSQDGFTVVEALIRGGGAEKSGKLQTKDKIIAVAQGKNGTPTNIIDMELREVVKLIRGKKGTKVTLTVLREGSDGNETFKVTIVRDKIDIEESAAKLRYTSRKLNGKQYKVGIIDLPSFYGGGKNGRTSSGDVKKLLRQAKKKGVDSIVLDLSSNGGGLLDEAVKLAGLFIAKGAVVATKNTDRVVEVLWDEDSKVEWSGPLVVLTSRLSASASEIVAGALKDYNRAVVVGGDHTFGKGSVQNFQGLPLGLGGMKVTMGLFFLPGGKSTQHLGVDSDITFPSVFHTDDIGEKSLDYSLPSQSIRTFVSKEANAKGKGRWTPINSKVVKKLASLSRERINKDKKFKEVKEEIQKRKKNKGVINLAEIRKKSKENKKDDDKEEKNKTGRKSEAEETKEYLEAAIIKESVNIAADLAATHSDLAMR